jgi:hypothetical protein
VIDPVASSGKVWVSVLVVEPPSSDAADPLSVLESLWSGDADAFSKLSDLLKVGVLPVVTLVIGYYFGTVKSE